MVAFCFPAKPLLDDQFYRNFRIKKIFLGELSKYLLQKLFGFIRFLHLHNLQDSTRKNMGTERDNKDES